MERRYEVDRLLQLSCTKKAGWRQDNSPVVRGDRGDIENAWIKLTKAKVEHQRDALMKQIEVAIEGQREFRRQERAAGEHPAQPILISVFLNKKRFLDEVVLNGEKEKPVAEKRYCADPECEEEVVVRGYKLCFLHNSLKEHPI